MGDTLPRQPHSVDCGIVNLNTSNQPGSHWICYYRNKGVQLIEAHNSIFNYDFTSLCETSLNESTEIPDPLLNDYTFIPANHPNNVTNGGVGLFYKYSLPLKLRNDLAFCESIVVELKFRRKTIFFNGLYRSPLKILLLNLMISYQISRSCTRKFKRKTLMLLFTLGISMVIPNFGGPMGISPLKVRKLKKFSHCRICHRLYLDLTRGKKPSCIDLIVTDQPDLILDSGARPSLDSKCHHQIIYCKINFKIPLLPQPKGKYGTITGQSRMLLRGAWRISPGLSN